MLVHGATAWKKYDGPDDAAPFGKSGSLSRLHKPLGSRDMHNQACKWWRIWQCNNGHVRTQTSRVSAILQSPFWGAATAHSSHPWQWQPGPGRRRQSDRSGHPGRADAFGAASSATACTRISPYGSRQLKRYTSRANELWCRISPYGSRQLKRYTSCAHELWWSILLWLHFPFFNLKLLLDRDFRLLTVVALLVWISMTNHPPFSCSLYLLK